MLEYTGVAFPGKTRIRVLDEHFNTAWMLARLLAMQGYITQCVHGASAAVQAIRGAAVPFDLLICDVCLPVGDGWQLVQQTQHEHPIPEIALPGYAANGGKERRADTG